MNDVSKPYSGAGAKTGDIVRNLWTGRVGEVVGASQWGRVIVQVNGGGREKWERTSIEVIAEFRST
jgi:hypothetical protein